MRRWSILGALAGLLLFALPGCRQADTVYCCAGGENDLLSVNRGWYIRQQADHPLLVIAKVAGFDTAVYGLTDTPNYPLVDKPEENLWVGTSQLSNYARVRFAPEFRWKSFWETLMGDLLGHSVKFRTWEPLVHPTYGEHQELSDSARLASVRRGVQWFFNGHFLVDSSWKAQWLDHYQGDGRMPVGPSLPDDAADSDGTLGILEGYCSAIDGNGRQAYRCWMRNDPKSPTYGLLSWAVTMRNTCYGDDNARSILGMTLAADLLGTPSGTGRSWRRFWPITGRRFGRIFAG